MNGSPCPPSPRRSRGFTLLEMLLALALVGMLMVGLNTFVFSMSEIWGRNREPRLFDQHVRAVTRYLESELRTAGLPPAIDAETPALTPKSVRLQGGVSEDLITFELPSGSRLLTWPERPLPEVICALMVRRDEGLLLLWHSRLERDFDDDPPREMVLTPLVTALAYDYYDTNFDRWETLPRLRTGTTGALETPQRLRLTFTYQNLTREALIALPAAVQGVPMF
jgi:prepilin-type N-terminal cleavage/methylation domain-containing protein